MALERIEVIVPPISFKLDGVDVTIIGVVPYDTIDGIRRYIVSCQVEWRGWRSQVFQLDVGDNRELRNKLRVEIARMKICILSGFTRPFQKVR
ncbi:MAG: hypothetical protein DRJ67_08145 [Thermoprotei archaeon]|nr:MAG: hypothetical protein DRJ67_08145 [Thermoprotei archaeon]